MISSTKNSITLQPPPTSGPVAASDEREMLIRSLKDISDQIGRCVALVGAEDTELGTLALLQSATVNVELAIIRIPSQKARLS